MRVIRGIDRWPLMAVGPLSNAKIGAKWGVPIESKGALYAKA